MFRFFIGKLQASQCVTKATPVFSFLWHRSARRSFVNRVESSPSLSASDLEKLQTVSYLVSSCGLSPAAADSAVRSVNNKNKERCMSVIRLLKSYGFSEAQIDSLAVKRSEVLVALLEKNLKSKLDFLLSEGFSKEEVADILTANPTLLSRNLERGLASSLRFLTSILPSRSDVVRALRHGNQCLTANNEPGIKILRDYGVSESVILCLLKRYPMTLMRSTEHIEELVKKLINMGFDPKGKMFAHALSPLSYLSKDTWVRKVKLYQELGWSEAEVCAIFKKLPSFIGQSDEQLRSRLIFFTKSVGLDRAFISSNPVVLQLSIEKRIVPRVSVLKLLMSKGLIKKQWSQRQFYCSEKTFFGSYVQRYVAEVPEIIQAYHGMRASEVK